MHRFIQLQNSGQLSADQQLELIRQIPASCQLQSSAQQNINNISVNDKNKWKNPLLNDSLNNNTYQRNTQIKNIKSFLMNKQRQNISQPKSTASKVVLRPGILNLTDKIYSLYLQQMKPFEISNALKEPTLLEVEIILKQKINTFLNIIFQSSHCFTEQQVQKIRPQIDKKIQKLSDYLLNPLQNQFIDIKRFKNFVKLMRYHKEGRRSQKINKQCNSFFRLFYMKMKFQGLTHTEGNVIQLVQDQTKTDNKEKQNNNSEQSEQQQEENKKKAKDKNQQFNPFRNNGKQKKKYQYPKQQLVTDRMMSEACQQLLSNMRDKRGNQNGDKQKQKNSNNLLQRSRENSQNSIHILAIDKLQNNLSKETSIQWTFDMQNSLIHLLQKSISQKSKTDKAIKKIAASMYSKYQSISLEALTIQKLQLKVQSMYAIACQKYIRRIKFIIFQQSNSIQTANSKQLIEKEKKNQIHSLILLQDKKDSLGQKSIGKEDQIYFSKLREKLKSVDSKNIYFAAFQESIYQQQWSFMIDFIRNFYFASIQELKFQFLLSFVRRLNLIQNKKENRILNPISIVEEENYNYSQDIESKMIERKKGQIQNDIRQLPKSSFSFALSKLKKNTDGNSQSQIQNIKNKQKDKQKDNQIDNAMKFITLDEILNRTQKQSIKGKQAKFLSNDTISKKSQHKNKEIIDYEENQTKNIEQQKNHKAKSQKYQKGLLKSKSIQIQTKLLETNYQSFNKRKFSKDTGLIEVDELYRQIQGRKQKYKIKEKNSQNERQEGQQQKESRQQLRYRKRQLNQNESLESLRGKNPNKKIKPNQFVQQKNLKNVSLRSPFAKRSFPQIIEQQQESQFDQIQELCDQLNKSLNQLSNKEKIQKSTKRHNKVNLNNKNSPKGTINKDESAKINHIKNEKTYFNHENPSNFQLRQNIDSEAKLKKNQNLKFKFQKKKEKENGPKKNQQFIHAQENQQELEFQQVNQNNIKEKQNKKVNDTFEDEGFCDSNQTDHMAEILKQIQQELKNKNTPTISKEKQIRAKQISTNQKGQRKQYFRENNSQKYKAQNGRIKEYKNFKESQHYPLMDQNPKFDRMNKQIPIKTDKRNKIQKELDGYNSISFPQENEEQQTGVELITLENEEATQQYIQGLEVQDDQIGKPDIYQQLTQESQIEESMRRKYTTQLQEKENQVSHQYQYVYQMNQQEEIEMNEVQDNSINLDIQNEITFQENQIDYEQIDLENYEQDHFYQEQDNLFQAQVNQTGQQQEDKMKERQKLIGQINKFKNTTNIQIIKKQLKKIKQIERSKTQLNEFRQKQSRSTQCYRNQQLEVQSQILQSKKVFSKVKPAKSNISQIPQTHRALVSNEKTNKKQVQGPKFGRELRKKSKFN